MRHADVHVNVYANVATSCIRNTGIKGQQTQNPNDVLHYLLPHCACAKLSNAKYVLNDPCDESMLYKYC